MMPPESSRSSRIPEKGATGEAPWQPDRWTGVSPKVLRVAKGIHVLSGPLGGWEIRTLGSERTRQRFPTFAEALSAALAIQREEIEQHHMVDVIVHHQSQGCRLIKVLEAEPAPGTDDD